MPIVELFDRATWTAEHIAQDRQMDGDIAHVYHEDAHGAFDWLRSLLREERKWCLVQDCPSCVVDHALGPDFPVRLLYAACLLSDIHYPFTLEGPTLPSFIFFLECLRSARRGEESQDPAEMEAVNHDAIQLLNGIEELLRQSLTLEASLGTSPGHQADQTEPSEQPLPSPSRESTAPHEGETAQTTDETVAEASRKVHCHGSLKPRSMPSIRFNEVVKVQALVDVHELVPRLGER